MNNISFNGRREVIYGLTKAAINAQEASRLNSISKGPRPINTSEKLAGQINSMKAYFDMTTYDNDFMSTVIHGKIVAKKISHLLECSAKKIKQPFDYFSEQLYSAVSQNRPKNDIMFVDSFLNEIKSLLK